MRLIGTFNDQHDAATLVDYLLTLDISARAERNGDIWEFWILDEDRVPDAKRELNEFLANRGDEKYRAAAKEADHLRHERVEKALEARRNLIRLPHSAAATTRGRRPLTMMLLAASAVVFVLSDFGTKSTGINQLQITQVRKFEDGRAGYYRGLPEIRNGEFWRIFSPMLIHFGILHFVFNMYWLVEFGSQIEARRGTLIFAALVAVTSAACNLGQYWWTGPSFGGMSGVNYGLLGYLIVKTRFEPWLGFFLHQSTVFIMIAFFFYCMTPWVSGVANAGHAGGLLSGLAFGYAPVLFRSLRGKS